MIDVDLKDYIQKKFEARKIWCWQCHKLTRQLQITSQAPSPIAISRTNLPKETRSYQENNIVTEAANAIHGWHANNKRKEIIDKCVYELIGEHSPGQMRHRFQLVIDEQL